MFICICYEPLFWLPLILYNIGTIADNVMALCIETFWPNQPNLNEHVKSEKVFMVNATTIENKHVDHIFM